MARPWLALSSSNLTPFIQVEGLHYSFGHVQALSGIDLAVERGRFVAVVGGNGSGKSTLARCLNGLLLPQKGRVTVAGFSTDDPRALPEIRRRLGLVFQNPDNQIVAPVVEDDVAFGMENLGLPYEVMRERVPWALEAVGLQGMEDRSPSTLSGGQKQRLAIAGILAMEPEGIILDEATSMIDPQGRREVLEVIQRLRHERAMTVIWITHHMEEALLADEVVVLHQGRMVARGHPAEILSSPHLSRWNLVPPPGVLLAQALRDEGLSVPPRVVTVEGLVDALCPSG
ncbi:MAG: energy-coupling factor transporter ATPase [Clostridiales bacterium]|nr:energy-coupling factor transporter ATPase [Clostridiales bacterium]